MNEIKNNKNAYLIDYDEYRELKHHINYSLLSGIFSNPYFVKFPSPNFTDSMKRGDATDILLLTPEKFNKKYIVSDVKQPSGQVLKLAEECFEKNVDNIFDIKDIANQENLGKYFGNTKDLEKREKNWNNDLFFDYLKFLKSSKNKIIITIEEHEDVQQAVNILKEHLFTKNIFNSDNGLTHYNQLAVGFKYKGFRYKILLDKVIVDHKNKIVYPFDLKTQGDSLFSFRRKIKKYRYDIQSSLYKHGLQQLFIDYEIKDFKDIVYSFLEKKPLIYNMSYYHDISRDGYVHDKNFYKGWLQLSSDFKWHVKTDLWEYPKEVYDNNGEVYIDEYT